MAGTGQVVWLGAEAMAIAMPLRKGSVLEAANIKRIYWELVASGMKVMLLRVRWIAGENFSSLVVSSPHLRRTEKARQEAACTMR